MDPKGDRHDGTRDRPTDERAAQIAAFETLLQEAASTDPTLQDPLIAVLKRDYRIVDLTTPLDVLVRSWTTGAGVEPARRVVPGEAL